MLFDQVPPDTSVYMIAGYSIFFFISVIYLASLLIRARNLRRDLDTLESLQAEEEAPAPAVTPNRAPARAKSGRTKNAKPKQARRKTARKK